MRETEVHPAQVAGRFYPAEPGSAEGADRRPAQPRASRRGRRAEGRDRAARGPRLFGRRRRDRLRPLGTGCRAAAPHRHRWPRPSRRVPRDRASSGASLADPAWRGSGRPRRSRPPRGGAWRRRRRAAVHGRAFARNAPRRCCRRCCRPRSKSRRCSSATRSRRLSPRPCAGSGAGRRRGSRSPPTCRISSTRNAPARSIPTPPGGSRRSTPTRSNGRRACGFLPIHGALAIAAERDMRTSALHLATSADAGADASRVVGYGAFALEYAASARLAEADRAHLLSACMAALGVAARTGGAGPRAEHRQRLARPFALARDLRDADRKRPAARLHRHAQAQSPADRGRARQTAKAACADPRFRPLQDADLAGLRLEVSILSHPRPLPARKRVRARERARTRPRRTHPCGGRAARAVPAGRLAATLPTRARSCAS